MEENLYDALNELRALVLMEFDDGKFRQVAISGDNYKKLTDLISVHKPEEDHLLRYPYQMRETPIVEDWEIDADTFIGLNSVQEE